MKIRNDWSGVFVCGLMIWFLAGMAARANVAADVAGGQAAYARGDYLDAFRAWKPAADAGDAAAQSLIATLYLNGEGIMPDLDLAVSYYQKAAAQNDIEAQLALGNMYRQGLGVPQDYTQAVGLLYKAAQAGHPVAQFDIAEIFFGGEGGVAQAQAHAYEWYRLAAKKGVILAQFKLGQMQLEGVGTSKDPLAGFTWLTIASQLVRSETVPAMSERVFPRDAKVETDSEQRTLSAIILAKTAEYEGQLPSDLVAEAKRQAINYDPRNY